MFGSKSRMIRNLNDPLESSRAELHRSDIARDKTFALIEQVRKALDTPIDVSLEKEVNFMLSEIDRLKKLVNLRLAPKKTVRKKKR